jgi:hypothetical protein
LSFAISAGSSLASARAIRVAGDRDESATVVRTGVLRPVFIT